MSNIKKILILGGGQAAVYAASELRKHDTQSIITIISEEKYRITWSDSISVTTI